MNVKFTNTEHYRGVAFSSWNLQKAWKFSFTIPVFLLFMIGKAHSQPANLPENLPVNKHENRDRIIDRLPQSFLTLNALPDNFSLVYNFEEFENGKSKMKKQRKLIWDFSGQRAFVFNVRTLKDPSLMSVGKSVISGGKRVWVYGTTSRTEKNYNVNFFAPSFKFPDFVLTPRAFVENREFLGSELDYYVRFLYPKGGPIPFVKMLENSKITEKFSVKKENNKLISKLEIENGKALECIMSLDGQIQQFVLTTISKNEKTSLESKEVVVLTIKQWKNAGGFYFPTQFTTDMVETSGKSKRTLSRKITVLENSIRVNQKLAPADFSVKIPIGTLVEDFRRGGIIYEADGISDELEESLVDALEKIGEEALKEKGK
jgi:hypothetical protein